MKLHFLIPGDIDTLASCYIYDKRLIEGLKQRGHQVEVHRLNDDFPFPSDESIQHCSQTVKNIAKSETVIVDSLALGVIPSILKELSLTNPVIGLIHLPLSADPNYSAYQRTLITSQEIEAFRLVKNFIVSSEFTRETLINFGIEEHKINLVIPGIDDFPQKKNYPDQPTKLLSIANMCRSKDHSLLVRALTALKDKDWVLHCYGNLDWDRDYLADFQSLIRKNNLQKKILIHSTISGQELSDAYLDADLFVHPSDFEIYGMALVEALAHGLPVIASTGGGILKTIPPKMGQFFKPSDVYGLQSILEELFENPEIYKRLYTHALTYKQTAQTWSKSIDLFEKAIK